MSKKKLISLASVIIIFSLLITSCTIIDSEYLDAFKMVSSSSYFNKNVDDPLEYVTEVIDDEIEIFQSRIDSTRRNALLEAIDVSTLSIYPEASPSNFPGYTYEMLDKDGNLITDYERYYDIVFGFSDRYSNISGISSFRSDNFRANASYGFVDIEEKELEIVWETNIGAIGGWTGVGWTGQPSLVEWDDDLKNAMDIYPEKKAKSSLIEVIYTALDGKIHFYDLEDGEPTRDAITLNNPIKGSVTVDPRGYPILYFGEGVNETYTTFGFWIYDILNNKRIFYLDGLDSDALRNWGAFDGSPLIDRETDSIILAGENGLIYSGKLNTFYDLETKSVSVNPNLTKYRYNSPYNGYLGFEASPSAFRNLLYTVDNTGLLRCLDIKTFEPVWLADMNDDCDASVVVEAISEDEAYVYAASEYDVRQPGDIGHTYIRKFNAFTGDLEWAVRFVCFYNEDVNGGTLATPLLGEYKVDDLIFVNIARSGNSEGNGNLYALTKQAKTVIWRKSLDFYSWSSPIAVYSDEGDAYLVLCDSGGYMHLYDARTGKELDKIFLESNVEGSPAAYGNMIVVGTREKKIWGITIK